MLYRHTFLMKEVMFQFKDMNPNLIKWRKKIVVKFSISLYSMLIAYCPTSYVYLSFNYVNTPSNAAHCPSIYVRCSPDSADCVFDSVHCVANFVYCPSNQGWAPRSFAFL